MRRVERPGLEAETSEGAQELSDRDRTAEVELGLEVGSVLRLPEGAVVDSGDIDVERRDDETMIINMGPQHPSTHGVLRLMLELDGETVLRTKPVIGYLHTGMEKTAEELTYVQGATNVTRMDYLSPLSNELVFSLAIEALLEVEMPPRAVWIRMLLGELNRISSHLMWMATNGMDLGSHLDDDLRLPGARAGRSRFFEKTTGLRMNHNFIRPGGVAADLPDGWEDDVNVICDTVEDRTYEYDELLDRPADLPRARRGRRQLDRRGGARAVGHRADPALHRRPLGPAPAPCPTWPTTRSTSTSSSAPTATASTATAIRLNEIRESIKIVRQVVERMPPGDYRVQDAKVTPPPRARIDESMEALIHHFKIFTEGFEVPEGEVYVAVESPRGELGCYLVSDGRPKPYRLHIRAPSFVNLQALPVLLRGGLMADAVAIISVGRPGHGRGGPLSRLTAEDRHARQRARRAAIPNPRSALIPAAATWPRSRTAGCGPRRWRRSPSTGRGHRRRGAGRPPPSTTCCTPSPSAATSSSVCTNIACLLDGGARAPASTPSRTSASGSGRRPTTACSRSRRPSASRDCDRAPCVQVNHRFVGRLSPDQFDGLDRRAPGRPAPGRDPAHGTSCGSGAPAASGSRRRGSWPSGPTAARAPRRHGHGGGGEH